MRRFYIEIKNPENSEEKVQFRKLKKAKSIFVKKDKKLFRRFVISSIKESG